MYKINMCVKIVDLVSTVTQSDFPKAPEIYFKIL